MIVLLAGLVGQDDVGIWEWDICNITLRMCFHGVRRQVMRLSKYITKFYNPLEPVGVYKEEKYPQKNPT